MSLGITSSSHLKHPSPSHLIELCTFDLNICHEFFFKQKVLYGGGGSQAYTLNERSDDWCYQRADLTSCKRRFLCRVGQQSLIFTELGHINSESPPSSSVSKNLSLMLSWHRIPYKDSRGMFLGKARQAGLYCCQALRGPPCVEAWEKNVRIWLLTLWKRYPHIHAWELSLLVCLFSLSPPEEKTRRQLQELRGGGGGCGRLCRAGRRGERRVGETEGGMEPSCGNCPTSMLGWVLCVCSSSTGTLRSETQIFTGAVQDSSQGSSVLHSRLLFWHTFPNDIHVDTSDCPKIPFGWCGIFVQAVIFATRAKVYCWQTDRRTGWQTDRWTDGQTDGQTDKYTELTLKRVENERRRKKEEEKQDWSVPPRRVAQNNLVSDDH